MKHIVIITTGCFPTGDSISFRLQMVAKAMMDGGNRVTVLCRGGLKDSGEWDGVEYYSLKYKNGNKFVKTGEYFAFPKRVKKYLNENKDNIDTLYLYCGQASVFKLCKKFCKKYDKGLIRDCPDWFSHEQYKFGKFSIFYQINNRINTKITDESFDIVAISHYLEEHFKERLSLERIAKHFGYSQTSISRIFHSVIGQDMRSYINMLRAEHVHTLLEQNSRITVLEAVYASGFENSSSFYRAYSARFHELPKRK